MRCLPIKGNKCEWSEICDFIEHWNRAKGSDFRLKSCLDVEHRNSPQPEVLLIDANSLQLVVERKKICYPTDYLRVHSFEHEIGNAVATLTPLFQDATYQVSFDTRSIQSALKRFKPKALVEQISKAVQAARQQGYETFTAQSPCKWSFGPTNKKMEGQGIWISMESEWLFGLSPWDPEYEAPYEAARAQLERYLPSVERKFSHYPDAQRILLLECWGDMHFLEDEIPNVLSKMEVPSNIDEVWITRQEWVSADDWMIAYRQVHPSLYP